MFIFLSVFLLLPKARASKSESLIVFDNFDYGDWIFGSEEKIVDYAALAYDAKMDLPSSFTICSSIHLNFMTSTVFFYQLYQDDGNPWFNLEIKSQRDLSRFQEQVEIIYHKELSNIKPTPTPVPIMPNSWYHGCTALDTVTGHMLVVVNGHIIIDQVIEEFINSVNQKPKSLEGRLTLFKTFYSGFWFLSRQRMTNLNVYVSALTADKMIDLTSGESCAEVGDYLSWKETQWNMTGNVSQESIVKKEDLCHSSTSNIVLFTENFLEWEECMFFCAKLPNTRSPSISSEEEFLDMMGTVDKIIHDPETGNLNPGVPGISYWIPVTDEKIEGQWVDYYTSDPVDILGVAAGEPNGGILESCGIVVTAWGGWQDWECTSRGSAILMCPCESKGQMILTLRGLCPGSNIDKYFVPQNKEYDGQTLLRGLFTTIIEYHEEDSLWLLKVVGVSRTIATSAAPKHSFLLGMTKWNVTRDNKKCNQGFPYITDLKLSGCKETEFTCHDGQCVKMEERCDQVMHCRDQSDENNCSLLVLKTGYKKKVAPFIYDQTRKEDNPVKVDVSTSIRNIIVAILAKFSKSMQDPIYLYWFPISMKPLALERVNFKLDQFWFL